MRHWNAFCAGFCALGVVLALIRGDWANALTGGVFVGMNLVFAEMWHRSDEVAQ